MDKTTTVFGEQPIRIVLTMTGILLFLGVARARADQVTLKNGDRLTGAIVKADGKTLLLKTDYAGDLTLKWSAVDAFTTAEPVHVALAGGQEVRGTLTGSAGREEINTETSGTKSEPLDAIAAVRNDAEEAVYQTAERLRLHPHLSDFWSSYFDAGLSLTRGNADNLSVALQGKAVREAPKNKFTVHEAYVEAR